MDIGRLSWAPTKFCDDLRAITFEFTALPDLVADIAQNERDASKDQSSHWPSNRVPSAILTARNNGPQSRMPREESNGHFG